MISQKAQNHETSNIDSTLNCLTELSQSEVITLVIDHLKGSPDSFNLSSIKMRRSDTERLSGKNISTSTILSCTLKNLKIPN